jgi:hypothetical protein
LQFSFSSVYFQAIFAIVPSNNSKAVSYYPFASDEDFLSGAATINNQALETDIPLNAEMNMSTVRKLKQLLAIIAESVPFKPNMTSIETAISVSRNNIPDYCLFIEEAGMIAQYCLSTIAS